jgi:hypothetical protein
MIADYRAEGVEMSGRIQIAVPEDVIRTIGKGFRRSGVRERRWEKWSGG